MENQVGRMDDKVDEGEYYKQKVQSRSQEVGSY